MPTSPESQAKPIVFIHIPKTGGTTFHSVLHRNFPPPSIYPDLSLDFPTPTDYNRQFQPEIAKNYRLIMGHYDYRISERLAEHTDIISISFLRQPIERVISLHRYWKRNNNRWSQPIFESQIKESTLESFLQQPLLNADTINFQTRQLAGYAWDRDYKSISEDELLEKAKFNLKNNIAAFGIMEHYDDSLYLFYHRFGWKPVKYTIQKASETKTSTDGIPQSTLDTIIAQNRLDLELYTYAQTLFAEMLAEVPIQRMKAQFALNDKIAQTSQSLRRFPVRAYQKIRYELQKRRAKS